MTLNPELLEILACPRCKGEVHLSEKEDYLTCETCRLRYAIREGIPIMLVSEAESF